MNNHEKKEKTKIQTYYIGADGGNTKLKLIYNNQYTNYDNIYAVDSPIDYNAMNLTEEDMDEYLRNILNVRFTWHNGQADKRIREFLFGELATISRSDLQERLNADKSDDLMLTMTTILGSVNFILENMDPKELKEEMEFNLKLSTGLPYHEYKIPTLRDKYKNHYEGEHVIEFFDPRFPVRKVTVNIGETIVNSEGMSALETTINGQGVLTEETKEFLMDTVWVMIDIGGYTTDIVGGIFRKKKNGIKLETIDRLSKGLKYGVSTAQDKAIDRMKEHYKDKVTTSTFNVTRKEINNAEMREGKFKGIINNRYKTNTTDFTYEEYRKLGRKIGNDFTQLYNANGQMDSLEKIYIAGGGALNEEVTKELISELDSRGISKELIQIVDSPNPVYVNAVGYYLALNE
ncbi:hypothetical protein OD350_29110 (plasmid) [Clostridium beijerinckii]|uniref:hypothetical protein n=1 Tax=Clostridium beijerinckii TaxID=1520 RepID=UPI002225C31F|nr:hypothetical protein [Clostridium beijerinckii]UYZ38949.1 hypothetical protein OD350_29110 [Clostridium beijerinckii]